MSLTTFYYSDRPPTTSADTVITSSSRDPNTDYLLTGLEIGDTVTGLGSYAVDGCYTLKGPADIPKTTIITPFGLFEFFRLPFDLRNAAQTFQG